MPSMVTAGTCCIGFNALNWSVSFWVREHISVSKYLQYNYVSKRWKHSKALPVAHHPW